MACYILCQVHGVVITANFKEDIIEAVGEGWRNSEIIVVDNPDDYYDDGKPKDFPKDSLGKLFKLKDVIHYFDYEYNRGFGGRECQNVLIYTEKEVFYVHEYDGSTSLVIIPRHPEFYRGD